MAWWISSASRTARWPPAAKPGPAFPQLFNQNTAITYWHKHRFPAQPPTWTLVRYNDDVHLYNIGSLAPLNWQGIAPQFSGGPLARPVRVQTNRDLRL